MDHIIVEGIKCQVHIGVPSRERAVRQLILIDLEVGSDLSLAAAKDDFHLTIDYEELVKSVRETAENCKYSLVETLAEKICSVILVDFPVQIVRVRLRKFPIALKDQVESVGVLITRTQGS